MPLATRGTSVSSSSRSLCVSREPWLAWQPGWVGCGEPPVSQACVLASGIKRVWGGIERQVLRSSLGQVCMREQSVRNSLTRPFLTCSFEVLALLCELLLFPHSLHKARG